MYESEKKAALFITLCVVVLVLLLFIVFMMGALMTALPEERFHKDPISSKTSGLLFHLVRLQPRVATGDKAFKKACERANRSLAAWIIEQGEVPPADRPEHEILKGKAARDVNDQLSESNQIEIEYDRVIQRLRKVQEIGMTHPYLYGDLETLDLEDLVALMDIDVDYEYPREIRTPTQKGTRHKVLAKREPSIPTGALGSGLEAPIRKNKYVPNVTPARLQVIREQLDE
jgi:hypothetical protein